MMWLALGIALTPVAVLYWIARTACDGARMLFMPSLSERHQHQSGDEHAPLARPLGQRGPVVDLLSADAASVPCSIHNEVNSRG